MKYSYTKDLIAIYIPKELGNWDLFDYTKIWHH